MWRALVLLALSVTCPLGVWAQTLPSGPVTAFDGRLAVGGEIAATVGAEDDAAYFN